MINAQFSEQQKQDLKKYTLLDKNISDQSIIQSILDGNHDDYGHVMRRYNQKMFRIARSIVQQDSQAMDVVQEAHINAFRKLSQFDTRLQLLPWLCTITRNQALMQLRKYPMERSMNVIDIHSLDQNASDTDIKATSHLKSLGSKLNNPEKLLENKQLKHFIEENLDSLPSDFRIVFVLRAVEQFSQKETAEILSIKLETVKTRFHRAKKMLQSKILDSLSQQGLQVYEVGGKHCDQIIIHVLERIKSQSY